jgi:hypothetical protein
MKKNFFVTLFVILLIFLVSFSQKSFAIPNPWIECGDDISCGAKKAGFNLPLNIKNYSVRAMKGTLEIDFPLDKKREVSLRKSLDYDGNLSGVYEDYPVNKTISTKNGISFNIRGDKKKIYVANFAAETGYYSFYSKQGMTIKDINYFYDLLEEAEAPRYIGEEAKTIEELQDSRRDKSGIVEPVYTQDCFPRTLQKSGVSKDCFERANLGEDSICSASELKMLKEYYKKGYKKDPLNNGCGQFCAE